MFVFVIIPKETKFFKMNFNDCLPPRLAQKSSLELSERFDVFVSHRVLRRWPRKRGFYCVVERLIEKTCILLFRGINFMLQVDIKKKRKKKLKCIVQYLSGNIYLCCMQSINCSHEDNLD